MKTLFVLTGRALKYAYMSMRERKISERYTAMAEKAKNGFDRLAMTVKAQLHLANTEFYATLANHYIDGCKKFLERIKTEG